MKISKNPVIFVSLQRILTKVSIVLSIFLLSIGASFIQRTTGFGFGIFIMTMLPFLLPSYGEATTLSGLLAITTSATIVWRLRGYVTWNRLWPILVTFIIVSTIAIFALTRIEDHILRRILGVALILISIYFILFSQRIKMPTTKKVQVGAGTLSGLMGGFFGMQGTLYGNGADLFSDWQRDDDWRSSLQRFPDFDCPDRLLFRPWWGRYRHVFGSLCVQAHPQSHLPLHSLCLHNRKWCVHTFIVAPYPV